MRKVKVKVLSRPRKKGGKLLGHIIRHHEFITNIFEGKVISHRERERGLENQTANILWITGPIVI